MCVKQVDIKSAGSSSDTHDGKCYVAKVVEDGVAHGSIEAHDELLEVVLLSLIGVCMDIYICVYIYIHVQIYVYIHICMHVYTYTYTHI